MTSFNNQIEKRRSPRVKRQVTLRIKGDDYDLTGRTRDISCIGTYCTVNKYIPPFSLISIILLLPLRINNQNTICNVRCQGVVVRTEENLENNGEYNIAIYFNRVRKLDKARLLQYVQQYL